MTNDYVELNEFIRQYDAEHNQYAPAFGETIMSVKDYAKMVGVAPGTIRYRVKQGRIKGHKEGDRWVVVVANNNMHALELENERLKTENHALKTQIQLIAKIIGPGIVPVGLVESI